MQKKKLLTEFICWEKLIEIGILHSFKGGLEAVQSLEEPEIPEVKPVAGKHSRGQAAFTNCTTVSYHIFFPLNAVCMCSGPKAASFSTAALCSSQRLTLSVQDFCLSLKQLPADLLPGQHTQKHIRSYCS